MKTLFLECNMGAAGDMLMSALIELHKNPDEFVEKFNHLGIPKVKLEKEQSVKCGITGTHMRVLIDGAEEQSGDIHPHNHGHHHNHEQDHHNPSHEQDNHHNHEHNHSHQHSHSSLHYIEHIVSHLPLEKQVKQDVMAVYTLIAEAESHAHGVPVPDIHFHEVGTMDAVADVVGVCMLIHDLNPDKIMAGPVNVGWGQVNCAHGILPVPAPATAFILREIPTYSGEIEGELCTPTGAALLKHFVDSFEKMPVMKVKKIGYGMGNKDFPAANCVRAMLGEMENAIDDIVELCCNLDDMTPEYIGYATELLMREGALDVYTTSVLMKKNRPGFILTCMCKKEDKEKFLQLILKHTSTLGIREYTCNRYSLERKIRNVQTSLGQVRVKESKGYGTIKRKIEYEDLVQIATEYHKSLEDVREEIQKELED